MTLGELCAVAYVLLLEELQQRVSTQILAATVAAAVAAAPGAAAEVQIPDWDDERAAFDARLAAEPDGVRRSPQDVVLDNALGLRR